MALFPSIDWAEELVRMLEQNELYREVAKEWEGAIVLSIAAEAGIMDSDFHVWLDPYQGDIREMKVVDDPAAMNPDFTFTAPYSVFKKIIKQEQNAIKAVLMGKIKVKGSMAYMMKHLKAAESLLGILTEVDTQFIDEK